MLTMIQKLVPRSRTPGRGAMWVAGTKHAGIAYSAASRNGAPFDLARKLKAAGVPDQPVRVQQIGLRRHVDYPSLFAMSEMSIRETASTSACLTGWNTACDVSPYSAGSKGPVGVPSGTEQTTPSDFFDASQFDFLPRERAILD
jgi:hypothetical protein